MRIKELFLSSLVAFLPVHGVAQETTPSIWPSATYTQDDIESENWEDFAGQAPLTVSFRANPEGMTGYNPVFEWHFRKEGEEKDFMVRYEENTEYTFTQAGTTVVTLCYSLGDSSEWTDSLSIRVTISESKLSFPNAFSPNGDGINDVYKAKEYQSLVEFHAYIFNRWGQKLFEWTDPAEGWDGTHNGSEVSDGVYFVLVKAKGGDGQTYNIRKDVNLLRGFTEITNDHQ